MALRGDKRDAAGRRASEVIRRLEGLRKDATRPVTFRMDPRDISRLQAEAERRGLRLAQLVKSWVVERMDSEGLR
jgi:hypothetical protein